MKRNFLMELWQRAGKYIRCIQHLYNLLRPYVGISFGIILIVVLTFWGSPILPNLLRLHDQGLAASFLTTIAGILASILGIVVAILFVALELLRRTYAHYGVSTIFKNRHVNNLMILYSGTIVIALLFTAQLSTPPTSMDVSRCQIVFALFVLAIAVLLPCCRAIIGETNSEKQVAALVAKIDERAISEILYSSQFYDPCEHYREIKHNPIYILGQAVTRFIQDDDKISAQMLIGKATTHLIYLLQLTNLRQDAEDNRKRINGGLSIYRQASTEAIKAQDEETLHVLLDALARIHFVCASNKVPWSVTVELDQTLKLVVRDCVVAGLEDASRLGFSRLGSIMSMHLERNCPEEKDVCQYKGFLSSLEQSDADKDLQWDHLRREYLWMVADIVNDAITNHKGDIARTGLRVLLNMAQDATRLHNLGINQKADIVDWAYYHASRLSMLCIKEGLHERILNLFPFSFSYIHPMFAEDRPYAHVALDSFGQFLIEAAQQNALTIHELDGFGAIAKGASRRIKESDINKMAVRFVVDVLDTIRGVFEENLTDRNRKQYLECHSQLESINDYLADANLKDHELFKRCAIAQGRFSKLEYARQAASRLSVKYIKTRLSPAPGD